MLKTIAEISPALLSFIDDLDLPLSRPQKRHIAQVADALITVEDSKTLSALYRSIVGDPCPKADSTTHMALPTEDCFRLPLWQRIAPHLPPFLARNGESPGRTSRRRRPPPAQKPGKAVLFFSSHCLSEDR